MTSYDEQTQRAIQAEQAAERAIQAMADEYSTEIFMLWSRGDGYGGGILRAIAQRLSLPTERGQFTQPAYVKKPIPASLRTAVFERDAYRCQHCGGHVGLTCDHIHPEVLGGLATMENLQTLCRPCNSRKGAKASA